MRVAFSPRRMSMRYTHAMQLPAPFARHPRQKAVSISSCPITRRARIYETATPRLCSDSARKFYDTLLTGGASEKHSTRTAHHDFICTAIRIWPLIRVLLAYEEIGPESHTRMQKCIMPAKAARRTLNFGFARFWVELNELCSGWRLYCLRNCVVALSIRNQTCIHPVFCLCRCHTRHGRNTV